MLSIKPKNKINMPNTRNFNDMKISVNNKTLTIRPKKIIQLFINERKEISPEYVRALTNFKKDLFVHANSIAGVNRTDALKFADSLASSRKDLDTAENITLKYIELPTTYEQEFNFLKKKESVKKIFSDINKLNNLQNILHEIKFTRYINKNINAASFLRSYVISASVLTYYTDETIIGVVAGLWISFSYLCMRRNNTKDFRILPVSVDELNIFREILIKYKNIDTIEYSKHADAVCKEIDGKQTEDSKFISLD